MKKFCVSALVIWLGLPIAVANAAIVTETWSAEVYEVTGTTAFSIGDTVSWLVTYDDQSTSMHSWHDGPNLIGQLGSGDDTLNINYMTSSSIYADADYNFGTIFDDLLGAKTPIDHSNINESRYSYDASLTEHIGVLHIDSLEFFFSKNYTNGIEGGHFSRYYAFQDSWNYSTIKITNLSFTPTVVPIPAAAWLFVSALAGLGWMRRPGITTLSR